MNFKFFLILLLCLNFMVLFMGHAQFLTTEQVEPINFYLVDWIFDTSSVTVETIGTTGGLGLDDEFSTAVGELTQEKSGGVVSGIFDAITSFVDGLKMALAFASLLTPIPIIGFLNYLGLPFIWNLLFGGILMIIYGLSMLAIIRGTQI